MQAAVGVAQLKKLPAFIEARKRNWRMLRDQLERFSEWLILPEPTPNSDPSWFGFAITRREDAPFTRAELIRHLESRKIATRLLFAGNLTRQPAYEGANYRIASDLNATDQVMRDTFWIGVYPRIDEKMITYMVETFEDFFHALRH